MMPPPEGSWGMPPEMLPTLPGYGADVERTGRGAQDHGRLGYGPSKPLKVKVSTRDIPLFKDPAVLLDRSAQADLLRRRARGHRNQPSGTPHHTQDYTVGLNLTRLGVDDPDVNC